MLQVDCNVADIDACAKVVDANDKALEGDQSTLCDLALLVENWLDKLKDFRRPAGISDSLASFVELNL